MILAVTGHRPDKLGGYRTPNPVYNSVVRHIDLALMNIRPDEVIVGMAIGVDQWAAEICIRNDLPFIAAVPFPNFPNQWPPQAQNHYRWLLMKAKHVHYVSMSNVYSPTMLHARNEWMVDHSDALLAVQRQDLAGERSGTAGTILYAQRKGKPVNLIALDTDLTVRAQEEERVVAMRRQAARTAIINTPDQALRVEQDPPSRPLSMTETRALMAERLRGGPMQALEQMVEETQRRVFEANAVPADLMEQLRTQRAVDISRDSPGEAAVRRTQRAAMLQEEAREHLSRQTQRRRLRAELERLQDEPKKKEEETEVAETGTYRRVIDID